tara:strand:- start:2519 stop:3112 length:594 start_codon:yes stop_codon:yes gene_type:complete
MREINKIFCSSLFFILLTFSVKAENKVLIMGSADAKINVKVFSSLTCPHCANFHKNIFEDLKKEYIDEGMVRFEHHSFPLDLAALNAEIIIRCHEDNNKKFQLLSELYKKQNQWAVGSDINIINESIKKISLDTGLKNNQMDICLNSETAQDQILNERIEAQKKYKIQSTPTIYINEKKYKGEHEYKLFKKAIEKFL